MRGHKAEQYDRLSRLLLPWLYRTVAADAVPVAAEAATVVDIGTGPGRLPVELARRRSDLRLVGVDPSVDMVALGRANADKAGVEDRVSFIAAYAEDLPFAPGTFDLVISTLSAHHWSDPTRALAELARVLRPGGKLRIYDIRGETLAKLAAGPLPASIALSPPQGRRMVSLTLKAVVATLRAEKASEASPT
jgi:ubiquinone/menaquinone biosynthesis C-methylase UbiE